MAKPDPEEFRRSRRIHRSRRLCRAEARGPAGSYREEFGDQRGNSEQLVEALGHRERSPTRGEAGRHGRSP